MSRTDGLRIGEIRAVFRLLNEIQEMRDDPQKWQEHMIVRLCRLLGARQGAAIRWADFSATGALRLLDFSFAGWPGARADDAAVLWQQALEDGGFRRDQLLDRCTHIDKPLATLVRQDVMTDRQWHARDDLLRTWAEMMEVDSHLMMLQRRGGDDVVQGLVLHRAIEDGEFGSYERSVLHLFNEELHRLWRQGRLQPRNPELLELSPRQRQVLDELLRGRSEKEAADVLGLSRHTVTDYIKELHRRFGVHSRAELMARFVRV